MTVDPLILAFTGVALLLTLTPGADTLLVVRSVISRGQRAGFMAMFGISTGLFFHATLSALGLSVILVRSAEAFEIVKLAGACYLVYLGGRSIWGALRHKAGDGLADGRGQGDASPLETPSSNVQPAVAGRKSYFEGLTTNLLNPKVAIFYLAFLPQFIRPGEPVLGKSLLLAGIHFILGIIWLSLVTLFLDKMRRWITHPRTQRILESVTGVILIGFGLRLAVERR
ncbi:MAG TPA: LysE family translocator [Anaerolineaceae bacterium]